MRLLWNKYLILLTILKTLQIYMMLKIKNALPKPQTIMIALIAIFNASILSAADTDYRLKGEQETPDPLFQTVTPKDKATQAGDEKIYLKRKNTKKIDTQITPDLLEQSLDSQEGMEADTTLQEIFNAILGNEKNSKQQQGETKKPEPEVVKPLELPPQLNEKTQSNSKTQVKPKKSQRNELITPDPLLDDL